MREKVKSWFGRAAAGASMAMMPLVTFAAKTDVGVSSLQTWILDQVKIIVVAIAVALMTLSFVKKEYTKMVIIAIVAAVIYFFAAHTGAFGKLGEAFADWFGLN